MATSSRDAARLRRVHGSVSPSHAIGNHPPSSVIPGSLEERRSHETSANRTDGGRRAGHHARDAGAGPGRATGVRVPGHLLLLQRAGGPHRRSPRGVPEHRDRPLLRDHERRDGAEGGRRGRARCRRVPRRPLGLQRGVLRSRRDAVSAHVGSRRAGCGSGGRRKCHPRSGNGLPLSHPALTIRRTEGGSPRRPPSLYSGASCRRGKAAYGGSCTEKREPTVGRLSASIRPPRDSTMRRARARPRPAPAPERAASARKNGSNTRSRSSGAIPSPVSSTATCSPLAERDAWTRTVPSAGVWRTAFTSRFWRTRDILGEHGASSAPFRLVTTDNPFSRAWTSTAATAELTISTRRARLVSVSMAPASSWTISNRSSTMPTSWLT